MSTATRAFLVNNNDSRIEYSSWFQNTSGNIGNVGPPLFSTPRGIPGNGTLQFNFTGTHIALFGITEINDTYPPWTCFIDGKNIPSAPSNHSWEFCHNTQSLADGQHSLTVSATSDNQQILWVDYISYTPSKSVSLDNSWVLFNNLDPDIHYDFGWEKHENVHTTRTKGSSMSFNFTGQSFSWYGQHPTNDPPLGNYTIDESQSVRIPGSAPPSSQPLFEIPALPFGPHSIKVTFEGEKSSTPLTLGFILVQNGTWPTSEQQQQQPPSHANVNIGGIVGGSLTAIFVLLLIVFLSIRYRERIRKTWTEKLHPFLPKSVAIETDEARAASTTPSFRSLLPSTNYTPQAPVYDDARSQRFRAANANFDEIDENSSYYGSYQTWGQIQAIEAISRSNVRNNYR